MSRQVLLVIGSNSYLAREFIERHPDLPLRAVGHGAAGDPAVYEDVACVVNFAFAPELHDAPYQAALDVDARAAQQAAGRGIHYVMMSSRRVYQEGAQWNASEEAPVSGLDQYGRNKLRIELALRALLGERLTILRPGNVVGYEAVPGRRRFAAYLQNQLLQTGRIRLSIGPQTRRDLVPVEFFCRVLREAMLKRVPGAFNVGSGRPTTAGDAARWLIDGFGAAELALENEQRDGEFLLDSAKLGRVFGLACGEAEVRRALQDAGRRLAAAVPRG
jgi:dTDP-4-dehydrorhamnose reductase/UDP-glucose 4-epimerase